MEILEYCHWLYIGRANRLGIADCDFVWCIAQLAGSLTHANGHRSPRTRTSNTSLFTRSSLSIARILCSIGRSHSIYNCSHYTTNILLRDNRVDDDLHADQLLRDNRYVKSLRCLWLKYLLLWMQIGLSNHIAS